MVLKSQKTEVRVRGRFQDASLLSLKIEKGDKSAGNLRQSLDTGKGEEIICPQGL